MADFCYITGTHADDQVPGSCVSYDLDRHFGGIVYLNHISAKITGSGRKFDGVYSG
jgi:hypothetical protein